MINNVHTHVISNQNKIKQIKLNATQLNHGNTLDIFLCYSNIKEKIGSIYNEI